MKLKYAFRTMEIVDELVAVPVGDEGEQFRGAIQLNETSADILKLLEKETTGEEIVEAMLKEYDATREEIAENVAFVLDKLRAEGLLSE